MSSSTTFGH
jgi:hypothetical protein